ncbi:uncharacterized protein LOC125377568 [Haliotis rufescens]|uniref:uncharacterized protein LOC125377568 n=1 Tax=Haliotis rufescens TaxID=6454 RepID=UPI00201E8573|nr:uncharacterized protein LOC125377568 [Haliotis rufescens]XP_048247442.1 uncharacterized protein LOC125377568 [Haliotis rufescens]XP_048247443.1 uncharacterized protein LOC125377568 [Haliotis rufescens]
MDRGSVQKLVADILRCIQDEERKKQEVVDALKHLAEELDVKQRDMNIAKTAFASGGIAATGLTVAGIAAAPFTFGASLGKSAAGVALGVSSGLGGLATTIADKVINSKTMTEAQAKIDDYQKTVTDLASLLESVNSNNSHELRNRITEEIDILGESESQVTLELILSGLKTAAEAGGSAARTTAVAGAVAARATLAVGKTMMDVMETGAKAMKVGGVVLSVLTVPLDLHTMMSNSIKIHKNTPSETAVEIRNMAIHLEKMNAEIRRQRLIQIVDKVPTDVTELAKKYDTSNYLPTLLKLFCICVQVSAIVFVILLGLMCVFVDVSTSAFLKSCATTVVVCGLVNLVLEMYLIISNNSIWDDVESKLDIFVNAIKFVTHMDDDDDFRVEVLSLHCSIQRKIHAGKYMKCINGEFISIAVTLILDVCLFLHCGQGEATETAVLNFKTSEDAAKSLAVYTNNHHMVGLGGLMFCVLSLPISLFLLQSLSSTVRGLKKSKVAEAMEDLGEDFRHRFHKLLVQADYNSTPVET